MSVSLSREIVYDKIINRDCPSCGMNNSEAIRHPHSPEEWPMKECRSCGLVYLEKTWALEVLYEEFAWEESVAVENTRRAEARGIERRLSKYFRKWRNQLLPRKNAAELVARYSQPGNILNVGSSSGHYLLQLPDAYIPYGIEIESKAVKMGTPMIEARGGKLVNQDALGGMELFEPCFFSGIIMRSFLEHDIRPKQILQEAYRIMKHGGVLVVKVPNYGSFNRRVMGKKWCGYRFPEHVNYFTPRTLTNLLYQTGFSLKRFNMIDKIPTSDNMWLIATK